MAHSVQDSDVSDERKRVLSGGTTKNDVIVIKNLVKVCTRYCNCIVWYTS